MFSVLASVVLFGWVHPASKLILDQGIPLSYFCVLYVGIRLIFQLPFLLNGRESIARGSRTWGSLLLIGIAGALLQLFEFKGIEEGLAPAFVTVLMFSYPIWILVMNFVSSPKSVGVVEAGQALAAVTGIYFVSGSQGSVFKDKDVDPAIVYPLLASLFIALWIVLSNRLRKKGMGALKLSAHYDLLSLLALLGIFGSTLRQDWSSFVNWSAHPGHVTSLVTYAILVGLLPNLLFYYGSRSTTSHFTGTALAFEPFFSAVYAAVIWQWSLDGLFLIGGILILIANLPKEILKSVFRGQLAYERPVALGGKQ
ncbi:MAG: DMT family transporter [Bdellovibrionales bacterium]